MKKNAVLITTILFFLLVNTCYFWEPLLGDWSVPLVLILVLGYFVLLIVVVVQIYFLIKERFSNKSRVFHTIGLAMVLVLTFLKPFGMIDFTQFESEDILVAEREGAANCMTTFELKKDFTFKERKVCFGVTEITGGYNTMNDTLYFVNVKSGRREYDYYEFAVIRPSKYDKNIWELAFYEDAKDSAGDVLWITKNEFN